MALDRSVHNQYLALVKGAVKAVTKHSSSKMNPQIRTKLFEVATAEFADHGFDQASLNRIIGSIGMSKSSFYHFFANKTELFQQIFEQTLEPIQALVQAFDFNTLTAENYWPSIMTVSEAASSMATEAPQVMAIGRMFHKNRNGPDGICETMMTGPMEMLNQLLVRGQEVGAVRKDIPPELLLNLVMALGMEVDRWGLEHIDNFDPDEIIQFHEMALGVFMRLLLPEGKTHGSL